MANKIIRKIKMPPEIKKSYNPFKMWGSWVGIIAVLCWALLGLIPQFGSGHLTCINNIGLNGSNNVQCGLGKFLISPLMIFYYLCMALGFLIGWGVHSLFRKLSK